MNPKKRLTRRQLAAFLRETHGIPLGDSTLDKLCMPTVNRGPPIVGWWGRRPLYDPDEALAWAEARLLPKRQERVPASMMSESGMTDTAVMAPKLPARQQKRRQRKETDGEYAVRRVGAPSVVRVAGATQRDCSSSQEVTQEPGVLPGVVATPDDEVS
jgi:hypothetical protein